MKATESSSSSPGDRLVDLPLAQLRAHPANANVMSEDLLAKLAENIRRQGDYPPLIVRPHPLEPGAFQLLDGHQRFTVLGGLGEATARCYVWPCDDQTALILIATLNRLEGQDDPAKRAELIRDLAALVSVEELAQMLPEGIGDLQNSLELLNLDLDQLLADLQPNESDSEALRAISFAVTAEQEQQVEEAIGRLVTSLEGTNRRGRALTELARMYLEAGSDE